MNKEKLYHCPFCKNIGKLNPVTNPTKRDIENVEMAGLEWFVKCIICKCRTGFYKTPEQAIKAWNTRPENPQSAIDLFRELYSNNFTAYFEKAIRDMFKCEDFTDAVFTMIINNKDLKIKEILKKIRRMYQ